MKRLFVIPYLLGLLVMVVYAAIRVGTEEDILPWILIWLATIPMLVFMMAIGLKQKGRTRKHLMPELALAVIATGIAAYIQHAEAMMYCIGFGVVGISLYDFWYSDLGRAPTKLLAGEALPDFELKDVEGNAVLSSSVNKPAVWMFIRGNWCPLCVAQVKEMAAEYRQLQDKGVEVFIITPQPSEQTRKLSQKFDAPMQFMVDEGNKAALQLGLAHEGGIPVGLPGYGSDTVYPTILITDENHKILYSDHTPNYRVRPEPADFLAVLNQA